VKYLQALRHFSMRFFAYLFYCGFRIQVQ